MILTADSTSGYLVLAYENLNLGLKLVGLCSEEHEVLDVIKDTQPKHIAVCCDLETGDRASPVATIKRSFPEIKTMEAFQASCDAIILRRKIGGGRLHDA